MKKQTPDQVLANQIKAVSSMTGAELQTWILDCLEGRDLILEDDRDSFSGFPLVALRRHLSAIVLSQINSAAVSLLANWVNGRGISDETATNLLLLIQGLKVREAADLLEDFAKNERFATVSSDLRYRVLQTLVALDANLPVEFWYAAFQSDPERLVGVVFDGLALISPRFAIEFLPSVPNSEAAAHLIEIGLPGFVDHMMPGRDRITVRKLLESHLDEIQPALVAALHRFFSTEATPLLEPMSLAQLPSMISGDADLSAEQFPVLTALGVRVDSVRQVLAYNAPRIFMKFAHQ